MLFSCKPTLELIYLEKQDNSDIIGLDKVNRHIVRYDNIT